jgi:hypothetical protein
MPAGGCVRRTADFRSGHGMQEPEYFMPGFQVVALSFTWGYRTRGSPLRKKSDAKNYCST